MENTNSKKFPIKTVAIVLAVVIGISGLVWGISALSKGKGGDSLVWYVDKYISINEESVSSRAIKAKTGLNFSFDMQVGASTDKLSLMISSDELPDILTMQVSDERFRQLASEGYLYSLDELAEKYNVDLNIDLDIRNVYGLNGQMYGLPNYYYLSGDGMTLETNGGMMVRKDWYEAYMEYVIDNNLQTVDVDGNGICDYDITSIEGATYAMRWVYKNLVPEEDKKSYFGMLLDPFIPSTSYQGVAWMCQYFGVRFEDDEGNYVDGAETEQFKQVVRFLNGLYNNDALNPGEPKMLPDAALTHTTQAEVGEVLARGNVFMFCGTPQDYPSYLVAARWPTDPTQTPVEYCSMIIKNDEREDPMLGDIAGTGYMATCITKQCKDPESAIKALAYLWSDEGQQLSAYGLKGVADSTGKITAVADSDLAETFTTADVTFYVDEDGKYHYTDEYLRVLSTGNEERAKELGVGQWDLLRRPTYINSLDWGQKTTNKESAYVNNMKKPLTMYSISYHVITSLIDPVYDYKKDLGVDYADIVSIRTKVNARWANMVTTIIKATAKNGKTAWENAQTILTNGLASLDTLGHDTLYKAYTISFKARKKANGITYGYPLNDPNYQKKTISEGGRYTWEHNGKIYTDVFGARGDVNYYYDYIVV